MKQSELYKKAQLLKAGQIVEIDGDWFRAVRCPDYWEARTCELCDLDSICRGNVAKVCTELDRPSYDKWYLKLAHR